MRYLLLIVFSLLTSVSSASPLGRPLTVVLLNSPYPPYVLDPEQGTGIVLDILNAYSQATGTPLAIEYAPEVRTLKLIETQQVDARIESEAWFLGTSKHCWSRPLLNVDDVVVVRQGTNLAQNTEFLGMVLFGRYGYTYPKFEALVEKGEVERRDFYSEFDILFALAKGEISQAQFGIVAKPTLAWYQRDYPVLEEQINIVKVIDSAPLQLQFAANANAEKACQHFNGFLDDFLGTDAYYQILKQYQPDSKD